MLYTLVVTTILCFFCVLFLLPSSTLYEGLGRIHNKWRELSITYRGEQLLEWLDNFGIGSYGHDLGEKLPARGIYKDFGEHIHRVWNSIQKRGGELAAPLKAIRLSLRQDLKRTRRERNLLQSALTQILFMLLLVWGFLLSFNWIAGLKVKEHIFLMIALWQFLGTIAYIFWLKNFKKKFIDPLDDLLRSLLEMHFAFYRGNLADAFLQGSFNGKAREARLFERMERTLEGWRRRGQGNLSQVDELFEDFGHLAEDKAEAFMGKLKMSIFLWCTVFILPPLFGSSLLGISSMDFL